ncbi:uncharacterized protein G2W53_021618 [Senna tora]|uniref:Uncharacterized protein n=1 Tax=Senna tora TaxID=362788 RepID=A0A834WNJ8_9FABA|nr:uncharacterized protein G2W53_021618 [Senna tora]
MAMWSDGAAQKTSREVELRDQRRDAARERSHTSGCHAYGASTTRWLDVEERIQYLQIVDSIKFQTKFPTYTDKMCWIRLFMTEDNFVPLSIQGPTKKKNIRGNVLTRTGWVMSLLHQEIALWRKESFSHLFPMKEISEPNQTALAKGQSLNKCSSSSIMSHPKAHFPSILNPRRRSWRPSGRPLCNNFQKNITILKGIRRLQRFFQIIRCVFEVELCRDK